MKEFPIRSKYIKPLQMRNGEVRTITSDTEEKNLQEMFESDGYYKIIANGNFQLWHVQSVYGKLLSSVGKRKTKFVAQSTHRYAELKDQAKTIHLEMIPQRFRSKGFETLANVNGTGHDIPTIDSSDVNICSEGPNDEMIKQPAKDKHTHQRTERQTQPDKELQLTENQHEQAQHTPMQAALQLQAQQEQSQQHVPQVQQAQPQQPVPQVQQVQQAQPQQPVVQQVQQAQPQQPVPPVQQAQQAQPQQPVPQVQQVQQAQPQQPVPPFQQEQPQQQQEQQAQTHDAPQQEQQKVQHTVQQASEEPSEAKSTNIPHEAAKGTEACSLLEQREGAKQMHTEYQSDPMQVSTPQKPCSENKNSMNKSEEITSILGAISQMQDTDTCTPQNEFKQNEFKQIQQPGSYNANTIQFEDAANDIGSVDQSRFAELESEVKDVRDKFNALSVYPEYMRNIMSDFDSKQQAEQKFRLGIVEQITSIGNVFTKMENTIFNQLNHMQSRLSALQSCAHVIKVQRKSNYLLLYILQNSQEACDCIANLYFFAIT